MTRYDSCLLVVSGSVTSKLQDFSGQVLEGSSQINWCARADSVSVMSLAKESMNTTDRELETSSEESCFGLSLGDGFSLEVQSNNLGYTKARRWR